MSRWRGMVSWDALEQLLDEEIKEHRSRIGSSGETSMIQGGKVEKLVNKIKGSMADAHRSLRQLDELDKLPTEQGGLTIDPEFSKDEQRRFEGGKKADTLSIAETIVLDPR